MDEMSEGEVSTLDYPRIWDKKRRFFQGLGHPLPIFITTLSPRKKNGENRAWDLDQRMFGLELQHAKAGDKAQNILLGVFSSSQLLPNRNTFDRKWMASINQISTRVAQFLESRMKVLTNDVLIYHKKSSIFHMDYSIDLSCICPWLAIINICTTYYWSMAR